ncbi:MAG TPA: GatB/YqeY domain-containing protein [Patescibacteria group bacterium]|jgi:hypothetical protein
MTIKQTLTEQMKNAMKAGEQARLTTLRLLLSEIKNFEIDHGEQDDAGVQVIVGKMIKQWRDALNDYKNGGREDLVQEAHERIQLLQEFMPEQASQEEIKQVIQEIIDATPTPSLGPITGQVMKKFVGKTDGDTVSKLVRQMLGKIPA